MANMTPMMRQYLEMKDKYPGMILFSVWATFTRCSSMTPSWFQESLS